MSESLNLIFQPSCALGQCKQYSQAGSEVRGEQLGSFSAMFLHREVRKVWEWPSVRDLLWLFVMASLFSLWIAGSIPGMFKSRLSLCLG